jgi:hypothetical protein
MPQICAYIIFEYDSLRFIDLLAQVGVITEAMRLYFCDLSYFMGIYGCYGDCKGTI